MEAGIAFELQEATSTHLGCQLDLVERKRRRSDGEHGWSFLQPGGPVTTPPYTRNKKLAKEFR